MNVERTPQRTQSSDALKIRTQIRRNPQQRMQREARTNKERSMKSIQIERKKFWNLGKFTLSLQNLENKY